MTRLQGMAANVFLRAAKVIEVCLKKTKPEKLYHDYFNLVPALVNSSACHPQIISKDCPIEICPA
jgi:hypothetical protein